MHSIKVRITLTEPMLGTKPANPAIFAQFIASKHPDGSPAKDELDTAEAREIQGTTGFHRDTDGQPMMWDYQIKGFFKEACDSMKKADESLSKDLAAHKTKIDQTIFVFPRKIRLNMPDQTSVGMCERPLRAETMQGPRVTIVRSEEVPAGTWFDIEIKFLARSIDGKSKDDDGVKKKLPIGDLLVEWLNYGALRGLGQWRNSSKGRFTWEVLD